MRIVSRLPNVQPRVINKKVSSLITRCNNPLHAHTKPCRLLWKCLDHFNANVNTLEYSIKQLGDDQCDEFGGDDECDPDHAHTETCRVYDI